MKWVTREKARVDRVACPWLITRFVDREPVFLFVPAGEVMQVAEAEQAIPYDVPGVELGHHGDHCSFDAFLAKYKLDEPALRSLALIVRGADTAQRDLTPESSGLYALATGFQARTWRGSSPPMTPSMRFAARTNSTNRSRGGRNPTSYLEE